MPHATAVRDGKCFYVARIRDEHWIMVWREGDEDALSRALDRWAADRDLAFTRRDSCRVKQRVFEAQPLIEWPEPDRPAWWLEWVSVGAFAAAAAVILRWVL